MRTINSFRLAGIRRAAISTLVTAVLLGISATSSPGGELSPPKLVKDINPGSLGSEASQFVTLNGIAYFRANDGAHGFELWRSDGTAAGTQLVTDLRTGTPNGFPDNIAVANDALYFNAFDVPEARGSKVWRSDGTASGTVLLVDTYPGLLAGYPDGPPLPGSFVALNATTVLFTALDPENYVEPWKTNGTPAGTLRLKDVHPGPEGSVPVGFTALNGVVYFAADDSVVDNGNGTATYNRELFRTDGTDAGTYRVKDINPGPAPSIPFSLTRWNEQIYFKADDGVHGAELWRTDGSAAGTVQIADLNPGAAPSNPDQLVVARLGVGDTGTLLFAAQSATSGIELFRSDGSAAGTHLVKNINPAGDSSPLSLTEFKGRVYFNADDGVHGREPWVTDGTEAGTRLLRDLNPDAGLSAPMDFTVVGDTLFFVTISPGATESTIKTQLWVTDGTGENTQLVYQEPGSSSGYAIRNLTVVGNTLLFTAPNGVGANGLSTDNELFALKVTESEATASERRDKHTKEY
jgi:ELWxxDGT repeat protein